MQVAPLTLLIFLILLFFFDSSLILLLCRSAVVPQCPSAVVPQCHRDVVQQCPSSVVPQCFIFIFIFDSYLLILTHTYSQLLILTHTYSYYLLLLIFPSIQFFKQLTECSAKPKSGSTRKRSNIEQKQREMSKLKF